MVDLFDELPAWHPDDVYALDPAEVSELQLRALRERFDDLMPRVRAVSHLADDLGVTRLDALDDVLPLCLPHTLYKSYSARYIEEGRYDRMSQWLSGLTTERVAEVDVDRCDSLESWLSALEAATSIWPNVSSGTSGKVSFFPRSTHEADVFALLVLQSFRGFGNEQDSGLHTGEPEWFAPIPMATGRQNMPRMFDLLRRHCYGGDGSRMHMLGDGHWDVDMLWLWGRQRAAEARGETAPPVLTPALERVRDNLVDAQKRAAGSAERFLDELLDDFCGRRVVVFGPTGTMVDLAAKAAARGGAPSSAPTVSSSPPAAVDRRAQSSPTAGGSCLPPFSTDRSTTSME